MDGCPVQLSTRLDDDHAGFLQLVGWFGFVFLKAHLSFPAVSDGFSTLASFHARFPDAAGLVAFLLGGHLFDVVAQEFVLLCKGKETTGLGVDTSVVWKRWDGQGREKKRFSPKDRKHQASCMS